MTQTDEPKERPKPRQQPPLSWRSVVAFVLALFVVGGLMFVAGRMAGHAPQSGVTTTK